MLEEDDFGQKGKEIFEKIEKIGSGTYGVVYKGYKKNKDGSKQIVAIKKMKIDLENEGIPSTALREITILRELDHPNIVKLIDVVLNNSKLYLLFEYIEWDLRKFLISYKDNILNENLIKSFLYKILDAVAFCHSKKIIHRDLKPQNILTEKNGDIVKVADFGLARAFSIPIRPYTKEVLTLWYRAPELLLGINEYSTPVDIWSIGCIFGELILRQPLFKGEYEIEQLFKIFHMLGTPDKNVWPDIESLPNYSKEFPKFKPIKLENYFVGVDINGIDLLKQMLKYDPNQRITAKQALMHVRKFIIIFIFIIIALFYLIKNHCYFSRRKYKSFYIYKL